MQLLGILREVGLFTVAGPGLYGTYRLLLLSRRKKKQGEKKTYDVDGAALGCVVLAGVHPVPLLTALAYCVALKHTWQLVRGILKRGAASASSTKVALAPQPRFNYRVQRSKTQVAAAVGSEAERVAPGQGEGAEQREEHIDATVQSAAAEGPGQMSFLNMLQQYGFKLVVPEGGGDQVFLMPPGAEDEEGEMGEEGLGDYMEDGQGGMYMPGSSGNMVVRQGPDGQMYMMRLGGEGGEEDAYDDGEGMYMHGGDDDDDEMFDEDEDPDAM